MSTVDTNLGCDENITKFNAKFSAHAEPRAIKELLEHLMLEGLPDNCKVAVVTDHEAIQVTQRKLNGFGGIGRGYALNRLFEYVNDLRNDHNIDVVFFYLSGKLNLADKLFRNFGVNENDESVMITLATNSGLFSLQCTKFHLCE